MPFQARAIVELVWQDISGSTSATVVHLPPSTTYAAADAAATALASVVASMTDCVLVRQRIKYTVVRDPSAAAAIGSSIKRRACFFWTVSDDGPLALIEIPSPKESIFLSSGPTAGYAVDLSNTDVAAFIAEIIGDSASNIFGNDITAIETAYLQSRV